jgi:hypothetical protein
VRLKKCLVNLLLILCLQSKYFQVILSLRNIQLDLLRIINIQKLQNIFILAVLKSAPSNLNRICIESVNISVSPRLIEQNRLPVSSLI